MFYQLLGYDDNTSKITHEEFGIDRSAAIGKMKEEMIQAYGKGVNSVEEILKEEDFCDANLDEKEGVAWLRNIRGINYDWTVAEIQEDYSRAGCHNKKDSYKVQQLKAMLKAEQAQPEEEKYGANLSHWSGAAKPINIDEGAIKLLIRYYSGEGDRRKKSKKSPVYLEVTDKPTKKELSADIPEVKLLKMEDIKIGDRVTLRRSPVSLGVKVPGYLEGGVLTVIGKTKAGNIKCDWDGGKPFYIPPYCLRFVDK